MFYTNNECWKDVVSNLYSKPIKDDIVLQDFADQIQWRGLLM